MATVEASSFARALANTILFAAPASDFLPALTGVLVEVKDGMMCLVATNLYVLATEDVALLTGDGDTEVTEFTRFIDAADVKPLLAALKGADRTVDVEKSGPIGAYTPRRQDGDAAFPKFQQLIDRWKDDDATSTETALNPKWLALLGRVKCDDRKASMRFSLFGMKPIRVTYGGAFKAWVMPVKG
jgi:DNA polymerase III sliding clamp (beta) subunit (PCNA family)